MAFEVSQNSFARVVNNTIRRNRQNGVLVLGSASVHIGVGGSDDGSPSRTLSRTTTATAST